MGEHPDTWRLKPSSARYRYQANFVLLIVLFVFTTVFCSNASRQQSSEALFLQPAFASSTGSLNTAGAHNTSYDITVEKIHPNNNTLVKKGKIVIYDGADAAVGIQTGIRYLLPHQQMYLYNGTYSITTPLNLTNGIYVRGQGNNTILDYSHLGKKHAILMGKNSRLSEVKISGSVYPLPSDLTQKIIASNNVVIENLSISHMGYGIETNSKYNMTLNNIKCDFIQSVSDIAACIHGGSGTTNLSVSHFSITDSNRGIELGDNSTNVVVQNGNLLRIKNFNHTGHEAFALDIHTHDDGGGADNVTYRHISMKDSYAPTVKIATAGQKYAITDLPRGVEYQNITVVNPTSPWQVNGDGVKIIESRIINNSKTSNIFLYKNSRNILIENSSSNMVSDRNYFLLNPPGSTGIKNVAIIGNTIYDGLNKSGATISLTRNTDLTIRGNKIFNAPRGVSPIDVSSILNLDLNNNNIANSNFTQPYFGTKQFVRG